MCPWRSAVEMRMRAPAAIGVGLTACLLQRAVRTRAPAAIGMGLTACLLHRAVEIGVRAAPALPTSGRISLRYSRASC